RLIRLSAEDEDFPNIEAVRDYFEDPRSPFRTRGQFATFIFNDHIRADGLHPGETLLFSYEARVVYVATAWSGRMDWTGPESDKYRYCLRVNLASLRRAAFTVQQLAAALGVDIPPGRAWQPLDVDGVQAEWAVNVLCGGP